MIKFKINLKWIIYLYHAEIQIEKFESTKKMFSYGNWLSKDYL